MRVESLLGKALSPWRLPKAEGLTRIRSVLSTVEMQGAERHELAALSGGQLQRLALAEALVQPARVLLLDEPLAGMDRDLRALMGLRIAERCKEAGTTVLWSSRCPGDAFEFCDRILILKAGRLLESGDPAKLYKRPGSAFVATLTGACNLIPGEVVQSGVGEAIVACALGRLRASLCDPSAVWNPGSQCLLGIRPESLRWSPVPVEENGFQGKIMESRYLGGGARHVFICGNQRLIAWEVNTRSAFACPASTWAWVDPEDVVAMPVGI
jgi:ABC-type Fe3+/spermidine/putrescine transport system ATPase subunit